MQSGIESDSKLIQNIRGKTKTFSNKTIGLQNKKPCLDLEAGFCF